MEGRYEEVFGIENGILDAGGFIGVRVLSGCSNSKKPELEYVDVSDLPNASKPEIPSFVFNETDGTETSESTVNDNQSDNTEIEIFTNGNQSDKAEIEIFMSSEYYSAVAEPVKFDVEKVRTCPHRTKSSIIVE